MSPEEGSSRRSLGKELLDREDRHAILAENLAGWLGAAMLILGVIAYLANMSGLPSRGVVALTLATAFVIYYYRKEPRDPLWKPLLILGGMWLFVGIVAMVS